MSRDISQDSILLERLLDYDLQHFASVLGYAPTPHPLETSTAVALLNLAERCSRKADDPSRQVCLTICGLITEYCRSEWAAVPAFIINLLSRIGLGPSMRMADPTYRIRDDNFASLGSLAAEVAVVLRSLRNEVTVGGRTLLLSEFQHRVWTLIDDHSRVGISAPTSAGKSYVLVHKVLDILSNSPGTAVFVVPTISLIHQVARDLRETAAVLGLQDLGVYHTYLDGVGTAHKSTVFVLTQERALSAFSHPDALKGCRIVVIDEVQNLERVSDQDEERARYLLEVIHEFEAARHPEKMVISGPRVENIGQLAVELFGESATHVSAGLPPVVNITYTFASERSGRKRSTVLKQYVDVSENVRRTPLTGAERIRTAVFSKQQYSDDIHFIIAELATRLSTGHGTLVFSPTSEQATRTALGVARRMAPKKSDELLSLTEYVAETVHEEYALIESLKSGIGFHHGKMPQHIRVAVEYAFSKQYVGVIVCTTTLMQGVNLPAKNLIARNPNLFLKRAERAATLTPYEFANLRGRAGRLMQDFVGRSLILDESFFSDVEEYVSTPGTRVASGYGSRFEEFRTEIMDELLGGKQPSSDHVARDLVTYIRQTICRHREAALSRFARVGIAISDQEFGEIASLLNALKVPLEVVERNPAWDPLDLEGIYAAHAQGRFTPIPNTPFSNGFVACVRSVVQMIAALTPGYVDRYLGKISERYLEWMAISAQQWSQEVPLKQIIGWTPPQGRLTWEIIDDRLAMLLGTVSYNLPKVLRPIVMMQFPDNPLLSFMELGAYRPDTRRLIELGLARETAIRCRANFPRIFDTAKGDADLVEAALSVAAALTPWDRMQVDELR